MKPTLILLWLSTALAIMPSATLATGSATVQLSNESIRMYPGDCSCGFGLTWTISFSSFYTEDPPNANGEFAPLPQPATYSHWSWLVLEDPSMFASTTYAELNLPATDGNGNGTPDFFEVGQSVSTGSSGTYAIIWGPGYGVLNLQWSRTAGSRFGTCLLTMNDSILGLMGPFTHTFELIEPFAGTLTYTPGSNTVTGMISLAQTSQGAPVTGPVALVKSETNRFNLLTFTGGNWTNQSETFAFDGGQLTRNPGHPTLYQGSLQNPGGNYRTWKLSIVDTNDANANGIPDLSDDPFTIAPPRRPLLALSHAQAHLQLRVSGDVGRTHLVQEAASPSTTSWTTVQSLTLTNDPQFLTLPLPAKSPTFWRVMVQ
ncbi:MAG: hypothetical protein QM813_03570 [Verrucomicrobiota bacterium]